MSQWLLENWDFVVVVVLLSAVIYLVWRIKMAGISFTVNIIIAPAAAPLIAVSDPLNLAGTVGQPFSADLSSNVQGGKPPYSFSVTGTPPAGLSVNGSVISGTPTSEGTTTLAVSVSDAS